jgi:cytochrome c peroxidase
MKTRSALVATVAFVLLGGAGPSHGTGTNKDPFDLRSMQRYLTPKQRLGLQLFFDTNLSQPAGQSCATCHDPRFAFTDPDKRFPTSKGVIPGRFGNRNTPTALYMAYSPAFAFDNVEALFVGGQFVDGRAATLEEQAKQPFLNPVEMHSPSKYSVVQKVRGAAYAPLFKEVYGKDALGDTDAAYDRIGEAIAAFENAPVFNPFSSKYDAWLAGRAKLTAQEWNGLQVYQREDKGNCAACHPNRPAKDGTPPLFTDFTYDNIGVPRNPYNPFYDLPAEFNPDGKLFVDKGLGRFVHRASENGKFKVPTLRNIAITSPYMHNGFFKSLRDVVDFYNSRDTKPVCKDRFTSEEQAVRTGCWPAAEVLENVNKDELGNLGLSDREIDDLVAFMLTLTDGWGQDARR